MSKFKKLKEPLNNTYSSYPYRVPVNIKALQHTKIKELQVRMMRWVSWYKDEKIFKYLLELARRGLDRLIKTYEGSDIYSLSNTLMMYKTLFGMVQFDGGGKIMMDFTEVEEGSIESGSKVSVHFRIRQFDPTRGFRKYFWKAVIEEKN